VQNGNSKNRNEEPGLRNTLKNDFTKGGFFKSFKRDFKELREYYITEEKHKRLNQMNWIKRIFMFSWWLLKSLVIKLTPFRRAVLITGIFFLIFRLKIDSGDSATLDLQMVGVLLIIFLLMLELKDKLLAHDELEAGRKIQNALMPEISPHFSGWTLMLFSRSANEVSGDIVDFIKVEKGNAALFIADVAGKGLKAALLTAKLQATVRSFVGDFEMNKLVSKVNNIFHRDSLRNIFASLLYLEISENSNEIKYVNAGHLPPVYVSSEGVKEMQKGNTALGLMKNIEYRENVMELKSGEFFFAYSDGLTEARNEAGDFYGSERLFNLLNHIKTYNAKEIGEAIVEDLDNFVGEYRYNDDLSMLILKKD
jgi:phosphoserine phosphatase RsbU/P